MITIDKCLEFLKLKCFNFCICIKSKKVVITFLIICHIALMFLIPNENIKGDMKFFILLATFPIPITILVLLILDTNIYKCLIEYWWFKFLIFLATSLYVILSNSYAANTINEAFQIDSSFFPITKIFLTYLYSIDIMKWITLYLNIWMLVFSGLVIVFLVVLGRVKYATYFFLITIYIGVINGQYQRVIVEILPITQQFALNVDFSKYHRCSNLKSIQPVLFIDNNKILYLDENKTMIEKKYIFKIDNCQLTKLKI